jgi:hypothetical protein
MHLNLKNSSSSTMTAMCCVHANHNHCLKGEIRLDAGDSGYPMMSIQISTFKERLRYTTQSLLFAYHNNNYTNPERT